MPAWELPTAPAHWVRKLTRWLPYHRDRYFEAMQLALHGAYRATFVEEDEPTPDPETVKAAANRALDAFSSRADEAMGRYKRRKGTR